MWFWRPFCCLPVKPCIGGQIRAFEVKAVIIPGLSLLISLRESTMSLNDVPSGRDLPNDFNVIIEIPMNADPIKYEVDKDTGAIFVDRFMGTAMHPLFPGVVVRCRPIGVLKMTDEAGVDAKLLAVPVDKVLSIYTHWQKPEDMNELRLKQIQHFFEHYKDLEKGKWVKVDGWEGPESAKAEILAGVEAYKKKQQA